MQCVNFIVVFHFIVLYTDHVDKFVFLLYFFYIYHTGSLITNLSEASQDKQPKKTSYEAIAYRELRNAILTGIFPPGYQVVEEYISSQLNMSRSPVRSAIKRLETEGFLEKRDNKRIYVALPELDKVLDILYIREALDGMCSRLAAQNRTAEDIEKLNQIMERSRMSIESGDIYAHHEIATVIHYAIFEASKRPLLARLAINYENQISLFTYDSFKQDDMRVRTAHEEHCAICRAVIAGDGDTAEAEARHHVRILRERMTMLHENKSRAMNSSVSQLRP